MTTASAAGQTAKPAGDSGAKGATMSLPDGRTVTLPPGMTEAQVRALFQKRFSGGTLTAEEQATMQKLMRAFGGGRGGAGGRPRPAGGADYQFGGNYLVIVQRQGEIIPVHIRTGLTDLDYSEVVWGLEPTDSVVILPSASLVQSQEEFKSRMSRMAGQGVPGMRQDAATAPTTQARPQGAGRT